MKDGHADGDAVPDLFEDDRARAVGDLAFDLHASVDGARVHHDRLGLEPGGALGVEAELRGVPVILWIYLVGFGVPGLGLERPFNSPLLWGSVALGMTYSGYVAEVFRAGIDSVHESQRAAARSLGLSSAQTMRHVVLPQAVRRVVPPLLNDMVSLQKDVALVSLIGPIEILRQAGIDKSKFANFTPFVLAALIFLAVTIPLTRLTDYLWHRERRRTSGTRVAA